MWKLRQSPRLMNQSSVLLGRQTMRQRNSTCAFVSLHQRTAATLTGASFGGSRDDTWWRYAAGSTALVLLSSTTTAATVALCETAHANGPLETPEVLPPRGSAATPDEDESSSNTEPEYPMYDNVPDEDVETDCFLCRTHRQGPCRPQWRNFEYCAKDHPEEEGAERCSIYVQSFQDCWMKHLNLYLLIAMTLNQERVEELEQKFTTPAQRSQDLETHFQWQEWLALLEQDGFLDSCQQVRTYLRSLKRPWRFGKCTTVSMKSLLWSMCFVKCQRVATTAACFV